MTRPDIAQARLFIELLTGSPDAAVTFQTFHDKGSNSRLAQIIHGPMGQCEGRLKTLNECGAGVFVTINETNGQGRTKDDIVSIRAVFMDCDTPEADPLRLIEESGFDPDFIVESSPGKFHAYKRVSGFPLDEDLFKGVQLALADRVQGDDKVKDISRVMRLPGFLHQKHEPVMTKIHEVRHPGRVTPFADLMAGLGISEDQARQRARMGSKAKAKDGASSSASGFVTPDEFSVAMREGEGRDSHMTRLVGWCARRGMSEEVALAHIRAWNEGNIDPLPDHLIVSAVQRMVAKEKGKRAGFALTELGFSERVVHVLSPTHKYVADAGAWIAWNGTSWDWDSGATLMQEGVKAIARSLIAEAAQAEDHHRREALIKHNARCENAKAIAAAVKLARSSGAMAVQTGELDQHHMLLACANAVIDLRTGAASEPDPFKLITHRAHVEYDGTATCPRWERFISEVFDRNAEIIRYVQKALGYCLTGDTREEIAFIFVGGGANGKSTLLNTVQKLMGDYAQRLPSSALMVNRGASGSGPTPEIARLRGARLAVTSEVATGRQLDEELLKNLVSQDAIAARFMRQDTFQFLPTHKIVFALNHLPTIASGDHGTWRRLRVIPFNRTFEGANKDAGLSDKLKAEMPGILNWLVAGCLAWQREGLREPDAVKVRTAEYRTDLDIVGQFFAEACHMGRDDPEHREAYKTAAALLYQSYRRYCTIYGLPWVSARLFGEDLKTRGLLKVRTAAGFIYSGVLVRQEWLPEGAEKLALVYG